jgi:hypothetical protein
MFFTKRPLFFLIPIFLLALVGKAQENLTGYWQPQVAVNYGVATNYSHNFSLAKRTFFYKEETSTFEIRQLDLAHFSNLKVANNQSVGLGLQYRFSKIFDLNALNEFRLTQQYNITHNSRKIRLGHRLRSEQRITQASTVYRFRYRFALDLPLQGEELNVGESYLVATTESLLSTSKFNSPEYDQRITLFYGWLLGEGIKLQLGTEFRSENYTQDTAYVLFLLSNLVFSL